MSSDIANARQPLPGERVAKPSGFTCLVVAALFFAGFAALALRLKDVQIEQVASLTYDAARQSVRRVRIPGQRGRILARDGTVLADNRPARAIVLNAGPYQRRTWDATATNIYAAVAAAAEIVGRASTLKLEDIEKHLKRKLARPLPVWRNVTDEELARFAEHSDELPGFECEESLERFYPQGSLAAHAIGYVGRDRPEATEGDESANFVDFEMRGRCGLEDRYDSFLRGASGVLCMTVDARGFSTREWTQIEPQKGPDLVLSLDVALQKEAQKQLEGCKGALVALDPRDGAVLAMASAPDFDLNDFVPVLKQELWRRLSTDPEKPLLCRATAGTYAPGSTFKPVTALAGLDAGLGALTQYECTGSYTVGGMRIRCTRMWGHGELDLAHALRESCNPYFCDFAVRAGSNAVIRAAREFGLGAKTGIDFPAEAAGVVPDDEWKREHWREKWYPGDLPQMAIGQGMLLATPLQMARIAAAIGVGYLVTPHLRASEPVERRPLPFSKEHLAAVRRGMELVVDGGTGRRAGEGVGVKVAGKTGTAEVGSLANRRKNTWFIAYAPAAKPEIAIAVVVERGESGGSTAAPKANALLRLRYPAQTAADEARKGGGA